jgi:pimeloyl-ACP methyl ester carboxylesterase
MSATQTVSYEASIPRTMLHRIVVDGVEVFYRAAGPVDAPVILLLHGFPTSSHMFRELIPWLSALPVEYPGWMVEWQSTGRLDPAAHKTVEDLTAVGKPAELKRLFYS